LSLCNCYVDHPYHFLIAGTHKLPVRVTDHATCQCLSSSQVNRDICIQFQQACGWFQSSFLQHTTFILLCLQAVCHHSFIDRANRLVVGIYPQI
jgi:hexokinase